MKQNQMLGVLVAVMDEKDRPLYLVRTNGMIVYYRYHDMSPDSREKILAFTKEIKKRGWTSEYENEQGLLDFLDFKDDIKICG